MERVALAERLLTQLFKVLGAKSMNALITNLDVPASIHEDFKASTSKIAANKYRKAKKNLAPSSDFLHWRLVHRKIACMEILNVKCTGQTFLQVKSQATSLEWKAALKRILQL